MKIYSIWDILNFEKDGPDSLKFASDLLYLQNANERLFNYVKRISFRYLKGVMTKCLLNESLW